MDAGGIEIGLPLDGFPARYIPIDHRSELFSVSHYRQDRRIAVHSRAVNGILYADFADQRFDRRLAFGRSHKSDVDEKGNEHAPSVHRRIAARETQHRGLDQRPTLGLDTVNIVGLSKSRKHIVKSDLIGRHTGLERRVLSKSLVKPVVISAKIDAIRQPEVKQLVPQLLVKPLDRLCLKRHIGRQNGHAPPARIGLPGSNAGRHRKFAYKYAARCCGQLTELTAVGIEDRSGHICGFGVGKEPFTRKSEIQWSIAALYALTPKLRPDVKDRSLDIIDGVHARGDLAFGRKRLPVRRQFECDLGLSSDRLWQQVIEHQHAAARVGPRCMSRSRSRSKRSQIDRVSEAADDIAVNTHRAVKNLVCDEISPRIIDRDRRTPPKKVFDAGNIIEKPHFARGLWFRWRRKFTADRGNETTVCRKIDIDPGLLSKGKCKEL